MFFHAQQMQLNQSFDAVKSRLGLTQVPAGVSQGPRHTIDAILGLNGGRRSNYERREDRECEPVPVSPGAVESAGELNLFNTKFLLNSFTLIISIYYYTYFLYEEYVHLNPKYSCY